MPEARQNGSSRRAFMAGAASLPFLPGTGHADTVSALPKDFIWGVSTSAVQIEGAVDEDGRKPSIWDTFAAQPGKIRDGGTPKTACAHYHRWEWDVGLLANLFVDAYRFSIAWPRVIPDGVGQQNERGWDFYARLVDALLEANIKPMPCLYHWDLPQALQDKGGWFNRDSAGWLADYAEAAATRLGDRVKHWFVLNEAAVHAVFGHGTGEHAPGIAKGEQGVLTALHHQNLAQGDALRALRSVGSNFTLGTVMSLQPVVPETAKDDDKQAVIAWDAVWNRVTLDGLMRGALPEVLAPKMADLVKPGDLERIKVPIDVLGMNYYSRMTVRHDPNLMFGMGWGRAHTDQFTAYGWPVEPEGITEMLLELKQLYGNPPVVITENGVAYNDVADATGYVDDQSRIAFIRDHVLAVQRAIAGGCDVRGYMAWSLLDNFEWQMGYTMRFGLVRVDFTNFNRIEKASYRWYRDLVRST